MRIDPHIDTAQLILRLQNGQRRLAYAVVNAINNTAKRNQAAERRRVGTSRAKRAGSGDRDSREVGDI